MLLADKNVCQAKALNFEIKKGAPACGKNPLLRFAVLLLTAGAAGAGS